MSLVIGAIRVPENKIFGQMQFDISVTFLSAVDSGACMEYLSYGELLSFVWVNNTIE